MKKILSLCINLLLLIISDAVPHKLIAGNHSVVKKDGATHNITKYYVVPNDFDANKNNNGTEGTQKTVRSIYSKSMQSNDGQVSENKTTDEPTDKTVNFGAELYDADHDEYTIKGIKESVIATRRKATDDLEAGGREANDNLKLENPDLQRRERQESNNDWIKTSSDSDSHQVTVSNKPTIIGNTQNLPKVYNRLSVSTLNVDDNENLENQTSLDSEKISRKIDYLLSSIKSRVGDDSEQIEGKITDNLPWYIEDRADDNLSWQIKDRTDDNLSWHVEDRTDDNLSWHVKDRTDDNLSWQIEDRTDDNLPWYAEDRRNDNLNKHVENRKNENLPWHIEDKEKYQFLNKITHKPITVYKSSSSHSLTKNGGKILMHSSKPRLTSTVHTVEVQNGIKKPYHILYATNPETSVHEVQNIHEVKSPNIHLAAISGNDFKTSTSHSGIKVVNKPSSSFYTSQILSNQPSNPHLKYTNTVSTTYNISNTVNPSDLLFEISQDKPTNQPKHLVDHGTEIFSTESQTKSHTEHKAPGVLFPNVPVYSYDSLLNNEPVSISSSAIAHTSDEISDFVNQLKKNNGNSNINLNFKPQANLHEDPISKAIKYTKYEEIEEDLSEPTTFYEKETKISKVQHYPEYTKEADNYGDLKLVYDIETEPQRHLIAQTTSQSSQSEYTEVGNDDNDSIPIYSGETHSFVSKAPSTSAITNIDYIKVTPDYGHTDKQTHSISKLLHYPEYETVEKEKTTTVQVTPEIGYAKSQQLPLISNVLYYPEHTEIEKSDKTTSVHSGEIGKQSHYISKTKSEYTEIPSDYINVAPDYGTADQKQQPLISNVLYYPEHSEIEMEDDKTTLVHGGEIGKQSHYISKTKSEYTNIPSEYDIYPYPSLVPYIPNNSEYTEIEKDSKYEHIIKPSLITNNVHRPAKLNYLKQKLAPSYQLFTVENLLKLQNGITKTIEINGPKLNNDIALINLKKIVNIIVLLAEHLGETAGSNKWYEKIFYITKDNRHPLQLYAHNLLRQRWLHELLSLLYKNNFNLKILQNPGIFSFLGSWKFPQYVQDFLDAEEMIESDFYESNGFDDTTSYDTFSTHALDDIFAKVPDDLEDYLTDDVINNYKSLDDDLVLGIAGLDAEPDAKKVTQILQKYLLQKSIIEKQENVIIRDNKLIMLKHVISFLKLKGYDALTISNLIRKLYTAVHSTEGKGCHIHHTNFAKNMYNVILPVLRSAGR